MIWLWALSVLTLPVLPIPSEVAAQSSTVCPAKSLLPPVTHLIWLPLRPLPRRVAPKSSWLRPLPVFSRALPGLAIRLEGRVDTHLSGLEAVDGKPVAKRWFYRQRMEGTLTREERPWVLTLDSGCADAFEGAGSADVEAVSVDVSGVRTKVVGIEAPSGDEQTIRPDADLLFVTGAGWMKKQADGATHVAEAEALITGFMGQTKCSIGSSKSLVDISGEEGEVISFLTHMHQVGQTGSSPRHAKGLASCCHGEEPHVVGWRFINERRAINTDAGCGWAQGKCDVLYIGDAFEIMKKVNELLG